MKALTKVATGELGRTMARTDILAKEKTLDWVNETTYEDRKMKARDLAYSALTTAITLHNIFYRDEFLAKFEDQVMAQWGALAKEDRIKRERWQRSLRSMVTLTAANIKLVDFLASVNPRGGTYGSNGITVRRTWNAEATLYTRWDSDFDDRERNPHNPKQSIRWFKLKVEVNWGGTTRSLAGAETALKVYRELLDIAHEVTDRFGDEKVGVLEDYSDIL